MTKKFKAHPLMILSFIKPTLFLLLLPIIKVLIQYIVQKEFDGVLGLEILIFVIIVAIAVLRWSSYTLLCNEKEHTVIIEYGFFFRRIAKIDIAKLSSVQTTQNPLEYLFRAVTYKINTEAGIHNKTDFEFKLSLKRGKEVSALLYGKGEPKAVKYSALKVAVLAATTSSAFTGMIVAVPLINRAGKLLGVGLSEMLLNEINNISGKIKTYFPPVVNVVTLLALAAYFISFIYSLLKYMNFKLFLEKDKLEVRSGLLVRARTSFRKSAINDIKVEQTLLMQILKRYALKVSVGGYGDVKSESEVVIPLATKSDIKSTFSQYFSFFAPTEKGVRPAKSYLTQSRFLFLPTLCFVSVVAASLWSAFRFDDLTRFILFATLILCAVILCYAYISIFQYRNSKISFGENIVARSNKGFRTYEFYCPKENVGEIKLVRFPPDLLYKTCRVRVMVRSERADTIRVRHLDYNTVKSEIYKCFDIE